MKKKQKDREKDLLDERKSRSLGDDDPDSALIDDDKRDLTIIFRR